MPVLLECCFLSQSYGNRLALRDFSASVPSGQVIGLLGPNGAGKSTLLRLLAGVDSPSHGEYLWKGNPVAHWGADWRRHMGYLPEHNPLIPEMTVHEHLVFCGRMQGLSGALLEQRIGTMVANCHLQSVIHRPVSQLSRGFRQRTGLAGAMLHDPELLLLDEPTTGLDPNEIVEILEMIRQLGQSKTVVHSTHILSEAQATCDRVWILREGRLVADAQPQHLLNQASGHAVVLETDAMGLEADLEALDGVRALMSEPTPHGVRYTIYLHAFEPRVGARVGDFCRIKGVAVHALHTQGPSLESVFATLTRGEE